MSTRCLTPGSNKYGPYPCGKCPACHARRISGWSFRLMMEERYCSSAYFITLTYAPENVRVSPLGRRLTLCKRDIQLFFKRLRKSTYWGDSIKYFVVGEYGTHFSRPHYHALVFNVPSVELFQPAWKLGQIHYGSFSGASVGYCFKYMCKVGKIPQYKGDDRVPEFGLFSKGLGLSYITPAVVRWHKEDLTKRMYIPLEGGRKIAMPRYFKLKIYSPGERRYIQLAMLQRQYDENKRTYQSPCLYIRLRSFLADRSRLESLNSSLIKERADFFRTRRSGVF